MDLELKSIQDKIKNVEEKIKAEYDNCPYDYDTQHAEHFEWFRNVIIPLQETKDGLVEDEYAYRLKHVQIGDGVTTWTWTDRYAFTVIAKTAKTITIRRDKAIRTDTNGMSESQSYRYESDPDGETMTFRWSEKKKRWVHGCYRLALGRNEYYDYSF